MKGLKRTVQLSLLQPSSSARCTEGPFEFVVPLTILFRIDCILHDFVSADSWSTARALHLRGAHWKRGPTVRAFSQAFRPSRRPPLRGLVLLVKTGLDKPLSFALSCCGFPGLALRVIWSLISSSIGELGTSRSSQQSRTSTFYCEFCWGKFGRISQW